MPNWIQVLFDSQDFMPHGHCFLWYPEILWLHVVSDAIVGIAYFSIPLAILTFARRRRDLPLRPLYTLFGLFIVLCGSTHFLSIWVLWNPDYGIEGIVKALTAVASIISAVVVWKLMPAALQMPSPAELQSMNTRLQEVNAQTEQEVAHRTAELQAANDRLMEGEKKLQNALMESKAASRAKTDFLANMSHEIRTPMNAIVGLTAYLTHAEGLSDKQKECLKTIDVSASALMDLINDLLDISKIEARQIKPDHIDFSLSAIASEALAIVTPRAREKGLELNQRGWQPHMPDTFIGDPARIRQILTNLLSNAVKFTERGDVTLTITIDPLPGNAAAIIFEIADTGIGITDDTLPHIFEKFTQGDTSISRKYGGSGLGLAITSSLIEQMGGAIDVRTESGMGSCFTVTLTLPVSKKPITVIAEREPFEIAADVAQRNGHILVVEDWQPNVLVISLMLEALGYSYEVAGNGAQALAFFEPGKYDAVLMDIQLPDINGFMVTSRIRDMEQMASSAPVPIIATTAYAMSNDREKCLAGGMNGYLAKPLQAEMLGEMMKKLIAGYRAKAKS